MNCRFCGTLVQAPPCDCPKCGRPVSVIDYTRSSNQVGTAGTIRYRQTEVTSKRRSSTLLMFCVVGLAIGATVSIVWYSRLSRPKPAVQVAASTTSPAAMSQESESPANTSTQNDFSKSPAPDPQSARAQTQSPADERAAEAPVSTGPKVEELVAKAQAALSRGDWTEPQSDNALKWAREARTYGSKEGKEIEEQIYKKRLASVDDARKARNYPSAISQLSQMIHLFPDHTSLPTLRIVIQREKAEDRSKENHSK